MMKLIKFLLGLSIASCMVFLSCKDEDKENEANLVGYWVNTVSEVLNCADEFSDSVSCDGAICLTYIFNSNGTFIRSFSSQSDTGTYSVDNDKITFCTTIEKEVEEELVEVDTCNSYSFSVSQATLRLIEPDPDNDCEFHEVFAKDPNGPPTDEEEE